MQGGYGPPGGGGYGVPPGGAPPGGAPPGGAPPGAPGGGPPGYGSPPGGAPGAPAGPPGYGSPPGGAPAPGGAPGAIAPAAGGGQYEFTPDQDAKLSSTGGRLTIAGVVQILWGLGQIVFSWFWGLGQWFYNLPISIALIAVGGLFIATGSSFKEITRTQGNDIDHLMGAVGKLGAAAIVQIIGFALAMVAGVLTTILIVFLGLLVSL